MELEIYSNVWRCEVVLITGLPSNEQMDLLGGSRTVGRCNP